MYNVYILQSEIDASKIYVGITKDVNYRLQQHNNEPTCSYTKSYGPWKLKGFINLEDRKKAEDLEKYFKTPSGRAFPKKRLI